MSDLHVPGLTDLESFELSRLGKQLVAKRGRNMLRSSFYDGRNAVKEVGGVIPAQYANLAFALGWAAKAVDGLANRCNIDGFVWPDGDLESLGLRDLVESNFLMSRLAQARTDSLIHGVSYLVTTQGGPGEPGAIVQARDGLNATGIWDENAGRLVSFLSVFDRDEMGRLRGFDLWVPNMVVTVQRTSSGWDVSRRAHRWGVPVEPLVYRPRTSRPMGRSRITRPVMSIQESALRALVRLEAHMDIYAIPKMIMLGADETIFKNPDGTMKASWQIVMGRVFGVPDDDDAMNPRADVKQFTAESPQPHLAQLNALAKLMARETDLPDADFALTDLANPTSEGSYAGARESLIAEAEQSAEAWSVPIRRTVMRALAMQNGERSVPAEWARIEPEWRAPQFLSRAAQADAGAKQLASVPWLADTRVGLKLLGLTAQEIDLALSERRESAGRQAAAAIIAARMNDDGA